MSEYCTHHFGNKMYFSLYVFEQHESLSKIKIERYTKHIFIGRMKNKYIYRLYKEK